MQSASTTGVRKQRDMRLGALEGRVGSVLPTSLRAVPFQPSAPPIEHNPLPSVAGQPQQPRAALPRYAALPAAAGGPGRRPGAARGPRRALTSAHAGGRACRTARGGGERGGTAAAAAATPLPHTLPPPRPDPTPARWRSWTTAATPSWPICGATTPTRRWRPWPAATAPACRPATPRCRCVPPGWAVHDPVLAPFVLPVRRRRCMVAGCMRAADVHVPAFTHPPCPMLASLPTTHSGPSTLRRSRTAPTRPTSLPASTSVAHPQAAVLLLPLVAAPAWAARPHCRCCDAREQPAVLRRVGWDANPARPCPPCFCSPTALSGTSL